MSKVLGANLNEIRGLVCSHATPRDIVVAAHEGAHAIVAMALGYRALRISHLPWGAYEAHCQWEHPTPDRDDEAALRAYGEDLAAISVASTVAGDFLDRAISALGRGDDFGGDGQDTRNAFVISGYAEALRADFDQRARATATRILRQHAARFDRLIVAQLYHPTLDESALRAIVGADLADRWQARQDAEPYQTPRRASPPPPIVRPRQDALHRRRRVVAGWPELEYRGGGTIEHVR